MLHQRLRPLREGNAVAICVLLLLLVIGTYFSSLSNGFVNLDDPRYVSANRHVQAGLTWDGLSWAWTTFEGGLWHPLTWLSLMVDAQVFGLRASGYHLTSLLLHVANTLLLFVVLRRITGATWRSTFVAALFGLHPLHVESVAWVAERKDVLSTFFFMVTLLCYAIYAAKVEGAAEANDETRRPKSERNPKAEAGNSGAHAWRFYVLALVFFLCGLLSKPMLVTTPFVLLLLDFWPLKRFELENQKSKIKIFLEKLSFFALSLVFGIVAIMAQRDAGALQSATRYPVTARVGNALLSYVEYLGQMIWPGHYAVFYSYPKNFSAPTVLAEALFLFAASAMALVSARRRPYVLFGWAWYVIIMLPVIGLIQVGNQARADRYTYVPLIGIFALLTWGAHEATRGWRRQGLFLSIGTGAATIFCMVTAFRQTRYWRDDETLYEHAIDVTPHNELAHQNLAVALSKKGHLDEAIAHWEKAVELAPDYALAQGNLGAGLLRRGRLDESILHSEAAIKLMPGFAGAHRNLGVALGEKGRLDEAIGELREALKLAPGDAQAHYDLGFALASKGRLDDAIAEYAEAVRLAPDNAGVRKVWQAALAAKTATPNSPPQARQQ